MSVSHIHQLYDQLRERRPVEQNVNEQTYDWSHIPDGLERLLVFPREVFNEDCAIVQTLRTAWQEQDTLPDPVVCIGLSRLIMRDDYPSLPYIKFGVDYSLTPCVYNDGIGIQMERKSSGHSHGDKALLINPDKRDAVAAIVKQWKGVDIDPRTEPVQLAAALQHAEQFSAKNSKREI